MNNFLTKIKFTSKDCTLKDIKFNVIKTIKTETLMESQSCRRVIQETTHSVFIGETESTKGELVKFIENRNIEITDSSCRTHEGVFDYFKPVINNVHEISFCITRDINNQFRESIKER